MTGAGDQKSQGELSSRTRSVFIIASPLMLILNVWAFYSGHQNMVETDPHTTATLSYFTWWLPTLLFPVAACFAFFQGLKSKVGALLALALLLIGSTNFIAQMAWGDLRLLRDAIANLGWLGLLASVLAFPSGVFSPRTFSWMVFGAGLLFFGFEWLVHLFDEQTQATVASYAQWIFPALFGLTAVALALRLRQMPGNSERQQIDWIFAGLFLLAISILAPLSIVTILGFIDTINDPQAEWSKWYFYSVSLGFAALAATIVVALAGKSSPLVANLQRISASGSIFLAIIAVIFLVGEAFLSGWLEQQFEGAKIVASVVMTVLGLIVLKPLKSWADKQAANLLNPAAGSQPQPG